MDTIEVKDTIALKKLRERIENCPKQIDNSSLYAGSPMYFYCKVCGHQSDVKPEGYMSTPKRYCDPCWELKEVTPGITDGTLRDIAVSA